MKSNFDLGWRSAVFNESLKHTTCLRGLETSQRDLKLSLVSLQVWQMIESWFYNAYLSASLVPLLLIIQPSHHPNRSPISARARTLTHTFPHQYICFCTLTSWWDEKCIVSPKSFLSHTLHSSYHCQHKSFVSNTHTSLVPSPLLYDCETSLPLNDSCQSLRLHIH